MMEKFDFNYLYLDSMLNPKPVLEAGDLYGKEKRAYELCNLSKSKVDPRKQRWAKRYLRKRGYRFMSEKESKKLLSEHEEKLIKDREMIGRIIEKSPVLKAIFKSFSNPNYL